MDDGPYWVILLMYGSHDIYKTHRFPQVDGGQRDPQVLGRHNLRPYFNLVLKLM